MSKKKQRQKPDRKNLEASSAAVQDSKDTKNTWTVEEKYENSHIIRFKYSAGWEQYVLLASDVHFDNAKCKRKLFKKHLDEALERNAPIIMPGDTLCLMNGKYDPRKSNASLLPQYMTDDYFGAILDDFVEFMEPYKHLIAVIGYGNHETSVLNRNNVDMVKQFCRRLECFYGGYSGWVTFLFEHECGGHRRRKVLRYNHGTGGGGEVSKGALKTNRNNAKTDGVDIFVSGHIHEAWSIETPKHAINNQYKPYHKNVVHIQCPTYKEEIASGAKGWANEREFPPKPLGGWWLKIKGSAHDVKVTTERAD